MILLIVSIVQVIVVQFDAAGEVPQKQRALGSFFNNNDMRAGFEVEDNA